MQPNQPRRRSRAAPKPQKTPFEKWVSKQGAVVWRLLLFIPISLFAVRFVLDSFILSDAVKIGVFTAILAAFLYIISGKWPLK